TQFPAPAQASGPRQQRSVRVAPETDAVSSCDSPGQAASAADARGYRSQSSARSPTGGQKTGPESDAAGSAPDDATAQSHRRDGRPYGLQWPVGAATQPGKRPRVGRANGPRDARPQTTDRA